MLAETLLVVWLITCVYVPFVYFLTSKPSYEVYVLGQVFENKNRGKV